MSILENKYLEWQAFAVSLVINQKADVLLLSGGYGSGKTAVNIHIIRELIEQKSQIGLSISSSYSTVRDVLAPTIEEEIPNQYVNRVLRHPTYVWEFTTESDKHSKLLTRTVQYSYDVDRRIKSLNIDFLHLLEATELPKEVYTRGIARLRNSGNKAYYPILMETNPCSKENWVYKLIINDSQTIFTSSDKSWKVTYKKIDDINIYIIHTTTYANPHFPQSNIKQMQAALSKSEFQRLVLGEWNALSNRVWEKYYTFSGPKSDFNLYANQYDRVFLGCDPGQDHPTAISFIGQKYHTYEIFDEIIQSNKSVKAIYIMITQVFDKWGIDYKNRIIDIWIEKSSIGLAWRTELQEITDRLSACLSTPKGTHPSLYRAFRLGELLRTKRLIISDQCYHHIKDCEQTVYKQNQAKEQIDKRVYDPHTMDACGYAVIHEIQ